MRTILQPFSVICCSSVVHEADVSALDKQMDYIMCMCLVLCVCVQNNVAGALCDECKAGFFHLSEANPEGCLRCFCMGVTKQCASSTWNRDQAGCQATNGKRRGEYFWYQGLSQCLCSRAVSADPFRCRAARSGVQTAIVLGWSAHV